MTYELSRTTCRSFHHSACPSELLLLLPRTGTLPSLSVTLLWGLPLIHSPKLNSDTTHPWGNLFSSPSPPEYSLGNILSPLSIYFDHPTLNFLKAKHAFSVCVFPLWLLYKQALCQAIGLQSLRHHFLPWVSHSIEVQKHEQIITV